MSSYRIHIEGQVQGIGFRPYVFQLAKRLGLKGWVSNGADGVNMEIEGCETSCGLFKEQLAKFPPKLAKITYSDVTTIIDSGFTDFTIGKSKIESKPNLLITPDLGICPDCQKELDNPLSRRYQYAFTTCTKCGPRYSIIRSLPYDRERTSMNDFEICPECWAEYENPHDRRFFSQTNSCPDCGVNLSLIDFNKNFISGDTPEILMEMKSQIGEGKIIAVKGIGGYLLLADATNSLAVKKLRERKLRPSKPFALLYPSIDKVRGDALVSRREAEALESIESPIVLLEVRNKTKSGLAVAEIIPQLDHIGVMLPYAPLLKLISDTCNKPLIATSGNISGSPIFYKDEDALQHLPSIVDYFLINDREIVIPQDDSVIQFVDEQRIVHRRSRGYAPTYIPHPFESNETVLAAGAELKSTFSLLHENNLYTSQYLGDLENFDTQENYKHTLNHFLNLFECEPMKILIDSHPSYYASQLGAELADRFGASLEKVQHHLAHFSAVLAENNLLDCEEKILGVIWDGTGWGEDESIWGGEFFTFHNYNFRRTAHLQYFDHILADKFSLEPRLAALSLFQHNADALTLLRDKFNQDEWQLYNAMLKQNNLKTSSVGRLFDAVASLLGLCDKSSYEGEAAMYLEACARKASHGVSILGWHLENLDDFIQNLVDEIASGVPKETIAWQFHISLVKWIAQQAVAQNISHIALSGGVFQNTLLVELLRDELAESFKLYFHQQLSPNDECISFGQLAFTEIQQRKRLSRVFETEDILLIKNL